jgi:hypothetical protein
MNCGVCPRHISLTPKMELHSNIEMIILIRIIISFSKKNRFVQHKLDRKKLLINPLTITRSISGIPSVTSVTDASESSRRILAVLVVPGAVVKTVGAFVPICLTECPHPASLARAASVHLVT